MELGFLVGIFLDIYIERENWGCWQCIYNWIISFS